MTKNNMRLFLLSTLFFLVSVLFIQTSEPGSIIAIMMQAS